MNLISYVNRNRFECVFSVWHVHRPHCLGLLVHRQINSWKYIRSFQRSIRPTCSYVSDQNQIFDKETGYGATHLEPSDVGSGGDTRRRMHVIRLAWKWREASTVIEGDAHDSSSNYVIRLKRVSTFQNWYSVCLHIILRVKRVASAATVNGM